MPNNGDLRVWNITNLGVGQERRTQTYPVKNQTHAARLINALANSQLLRPDVETNAFGLEVYHDGDWEEWVDDEGNDIDLWADKMEEGFNDPLYHDEAQVPDA